MSDPEGAPQFEHQADPAVLVVRGELDTVVRDEFTVAVAEALAAAPDPPLVVDLAGVTFMDSSALAVLIGATNEGHQIVVRDASASARRVLEATGLTEVLGMEP